MCVPVLKIPDFLFLQTGNILRILLQLMVNFSRMNYVSITGRILANMKKELSQVVEEEEGLILVQRDAFSFGNYWSFHRWKNKWKHRVHLTIVRK